MVSLMFLQKIKELEKNKKFKFKPSGGLSDEEINKMVKDAEANKEADKKKRESVMLETRQIV
jgi:molecular chaperone DnaK